MEFFHDIPPYLGANINYITLFSHKLHPYSGLIALVNKKLFNIALLCSIKRSNLAGY